VKQIFFIAELGAGISTEIAFSAVPLFSPAVIAMFDELPNPETVWQRGAQQVEGL